MGTDPSCACGQLCVHVGSCACTSSSIVSAKRLAVASPLAPSTIRPSMQNCVTVSHHEPCSIFLMPPDEVMIACGHETAASSTQGCNLACTGRQPRVHRAATTGAQGCSLGCRESSAQCCKPRVHGAAGRCGPMRAGACLDALHLVVHHAIDHHRAEVLLEGEVAEAVDRLVVLDEEGQHGELTARDALLDVVPQRARLPRDGRV